MTEGSYWFRRFVKDIKNLSPHFKFLPIQHGWYRIYWTGGGEPAYIHEVWKYMPHKGYNIEQMDPNVVSQKYYQEYEDQLTLTRKIKNFVEGYWDSMRTMELRYYQLRNDREFRETATKAYRTIKVK